MSVKRNVIAGWASHLVIVLIGFFLMPFILGTVGDAKYGAWLYINAIASYSGIVYAGFGATICRYSADLSARQEWKKLNQYVSSIQAVYIVTASVVVLLTILVAYFAPSISDWDGLSLWEVRTSIIIVGFTIGFGMVASVYGGVLIGAQRLDILRGIEVVCGLIRLALVIYFLQASSGLIMLATLFLIVTVIEHGASAFFAYRAIPTLSIGPWNFCRTAMKDCFEFSAFNAVALAAENLIYFTDTVVVGFFLGPVAVVVYGIGLRIAQMIQVPIVQVGQAVLPKAGELHAKQHNAELRDLVAKAMGISLLFAGGFYIGATYFGQLFIETWIGKSYPLSSTIMIILLGAQIVALPMMIVRKTLLGMGEVRVTAFIDLAQAFLNLILSVIFVQLFGIVGVAWGTLIPLTLVELLVFLPYAAKRLKLSRNTLINRVVAPQIPALVALMAYCHLAASYVNQPGWLPIIAVTAGGGVVLLATRYATHLFEKRITAIDLSTSHSAPSHQTVAK